MTRSARLAYVREIGERMPSCKCAPSLAPLPLGLPAELVVPGPGGAPSELTVAAALLTVIEPSASFVTLPAASVIARLAAYAPSARASVLTVKPLTVSVRGQAFQES